LPFGHVYVAVSESNYTEGWLRAGEELDITFRVRGPMSRGSTWDCPVCGAPLEGPASFEMTLCPDCGSCSFAPGSVAGFSRCVRKVMVASPPQTEAPMPAFFQGLTIRLPSDSFLIIDLTQTAVTSDTVGGIVPLHKKAMSNRSMLRLVMPDDHPSRELFRITRLDKVFTLYMTTDEALAAVF